MGTRPDTGLLSNCPHPIDELRLTYAPSESDLWDGGRIPVTATGVGRIPKLNWKAVKQGLPWLPVHVEAASV